MANNDYTLTILGCGTMGSAVLNSILTNPNKGIIPTKIYTINSRESTKESLQLKYKSQITALSTSEHELVAQAINESKVVIVGLKPYATQHVLDSFSANAFQGKLLISLVAGWTMEQFGKYSDLVARVMTNTPAKFGHGMAAISMNQKVSQESQLSDLVKSLIDNIGKLIIIPESKMDSATSLIGSGPAFVLLIIESMVDSGIKLGFSYDDSLKSVLQVMKGTVEMTELTHLHPAVLKTQVCTPGGTTINGLAKMEENGIRNAIIQGVEKAKDVAAQLGKK